MDNYIKKDSVTPEDSVQEKRNCQDEPMLLDSACSTTNAMVSK